MAARVETQAARQGRLAILAGAGGLPLHVACAARASGEDPFIIVLHAEADRGWGDFDNTAIGTGDFAGLEAILGRHGIDRVVLSGGVRRRRGVDARRCRTH